MALPFTTLVCCLMASTGSGQVSIPVEEGDALVTFDKQEFRLTPDSGSTSTFVVYKDWYERVHGKGSCLKLPTGCYTCSTPCDPSKAKKFKLTFKEGTTVTFAEHVGTLTIAGVTVKAFTFGLIIGYQPGPGIPDTPGGYLGLGYPIPTGPPTFLGQLFAKKVIPKMLYTFNTPGVTPFHNGKITFGGGDKLTMTIVPLRGSAVSHVPDSILEKIAMRTSKGRTFVDTVAYTGIYDTGTTTIMIPNLKGILRKITTFTSSDMGATVKVKLDNGWWKIEQKGLKYMPTLFFVVGPAGKQFSVSFTPSQYTANCASRWCSLLLDDSNNNYVILGQPFFGEYLASISLDQNYIGIARYK